MLAAKKSGKDMKKDVDPLEMDTDVKLETKEEVRDDSETQLMTTDGSVFYNTIEISANALNRQIQIQTDQSDNLADTSASDFKFELIAARANLTSNYHVESILLDGNDQGYSKGSNQEVVIINAEDLQVESQTVEAAVQALVHDDSIVKLTAATSDNLADDSKYTKKIDAVPPATEPKFLFSSQFQQPEHISHTNFVLTSEDGKTYKIAPAHQVIQFSSPGTVDSVPQIGIAESQIFPSSVSTFQYVLPNNGGLARNQMPVQFLNVSSPPTTHLQQEVISSSEITTLPPTLLQNQDLKPPVLTLGTGNKLPDNESINVEESRVHVIDGISEDAPELLGNEEERCISTVSLKAKSKKDPLAINTISYVMAPEVQNISAANTINVNVPGMPGVVCQMQRYLYTQGLCRVCLLAKNDLVSIFEDVNITSSGIIENSRGPHAANKYNIIPAIKTLLDIEVNFGDGLPEQICLDCIDNLTSFSVFRKRIAIGQGKLNEILAQVQGSSTPTVIPELGEVDMKKTGVFRHAESIIQAKDILKYSTFSHLVERSLSDRVWEKIFQSLSVMVGFKSGKLKGIESFAVDQPYVNGWFCYSCNVTIHGPKENYREHHMQIHGTKSTDEVLFPCDICANTYPVTERSGVTQSYGEHWLQHFFFFGCTECSKRMPSQKGLWVHRRSAHNAGEKVFECPECDKSFFKKAHLDAHKKTHLDPEEKKRHLNWCKLCGKGLTSSLTAHMASVHSNDRPWRCEICNKQFKRKEILNGHRETVHYNMKKYECEICGEFLKSHSTKALHVLRHKGEKPHACEVCNKRFYSTHSMKSHMLKHQDVGEVACTVCDKVFKRKMYLVEHMRLHTGEKPHECHICGKQIRMKSNFFKHMKVHKRREAEKLARQARVMTMTAVDD